MAVRPGATWIVAVLTGASGLLFAATSWRHGLSSEPPPRRERNHAEIPIPKEA